MIRHSLRCSITVQLCLTALIKDWLINIKLNSKFLMLDLTPMNVREVTLMEISISFAGMMN